MDFVTVTHPPTATQLFMDGGYPDDEPERFKRWRSTLHKVGRTHASSATREDWLDIDDYLNSLLGATESLLGQWGMDKEERASIRREVKALRTWRDRIRIALEADPS